MIGAKSPITEVTRPEFAVKPICRVLLGIGGSLLVSALYMGFVHHAHPAIVFSLLGLTTLVFAMVWGVLMKPQAFGFVGAANPPKHPAAHVKN